VGKPAKSISPRAFVDKYRKQVLFVPRMTTGFRNNVLFRHAEPHSAPRAPRDKFAADKKPTDPSSRYSMRHA